MTLTIGQMVEDFNKSLNYYGDAVISPLTAKKHVNNIVFLLERVFKVEIVGKIDKNNKTKFNLKLFYKNKQILDYIKLRYDNLETQKTNITSILALLRLYKKDTKNNSDKMTVNYLKYVNYSKMLRDKMEIDKVENKDEILKIKNTITDQESTELIEKYLKKFDKNKKLKILQDAIIIMIYTKLPPSRLDYVDMLFTKNYSVDFKKYKTKYNYVDITEGIFYIHNFKGSTHTKKHGEIIITPEILKYINILFNNRDYGDELPIFLLDNQEKPMTAHYLGIKLKRLTGLSVNDYRHLIMCDKSAPIENVDEFCEKYKSLEKLASSMNTSINRLVHTYHCKN